MGSQIAYLHRVCDGENKSSLNQAPAKLTPCCGKSAAPGFFAFLLPEDSGFGFTSPAGTSENPVLDRRVYQIHGRQHGQFPQHSHAGIRSTGFNSNQLIGWQIRISIIYHVKSDAAIFWWWFLFCAGRSFQATLRLTKSSKQIQWRHLRLNLKN